MPPKLTSRPSRARLERVPSLGGLVDNLKAVFQKYDRDGSKGLDREELALAFKDFGLRLSRARVDEMFDMADVDGSGTIDFAEFVCFVAELRQQSPPPPSLLASALSSLADTSRLLGRLFAAPLATSAGFQVFLGGSCNPTTWRRDVAIPRLKRAYISFYNPQVDDWRPELIELEARAKDQASLLFFVVDRQTRAVVSLLEAAYLIGQRRPLVLVVEQVEAGLEVQDQVVTKPEAADLNRGRLLLSDLASSSGQALFDNISDAVDEAIRMVKSPSGRSSPKGGPPGEGPGEELRVGHLLMELRELFEQYDADRSGALSRDEFKLLLSGLNLSPTDREWKTVVEHGDQNQDGQIDFGEFVALFAYLSESRASQRRGLLSQLTSMFGDAVSAATSLTMTTLNSMLRRQTSPPMLEAHEVQVFLGGSCGASTWRQDTAVPALLRAGVTFCNPQRSDWTPAVIPWEAKQKAAAQILLFVVDSSTRAVGTMTEAAYYIGRGRRVVLVVNDIADEAEIGGEVITGRELKDLNRGRAYLKDTANRAHMAVYDDVKTAIADIISMVRRG